MTASTPSVAAMASMSSWLSTWPSMNAALMRPRVETTRRSNTFWPLYQSWPARRMPGATLSRPDSIMTPSRTMPNTEAKRLLLAASSRHIFLR